MPETNRRVLVVDDDNDVRNILASVLVKRGLTVDTAGDGRIALDLLTANAYSVVVLDLLMPNIDGFDVLQQLQAAEMPFPAPVVLVLTGAEEAIVERLNPQRIHGLVRKPFEPDDLASLVVACVEVKSRRPFGAMALTMLSSAQLLAWLERFSR